MREIKLSSDISLIKKGETVLWIKVLGVKVHITILQVSDHREVMNRLVEQFKK